MLEFGGGPQGFHIYPLCRFVVSPKELSSLVFCRHPGMPGGPQGSGSSSLFVVVVAFPFCAVFGPAKYKRVVIVFFFDKF